MLGWSGAQRLVNKQSTDDFPREKDVLNSVCSVTDGSMVIVDLSPKTSGSQILTHM